MRLSCLPDDERPRERLFNKGADSLTLAELLAILFRTGTQERDVMSLAAAVLQEWGGLRGLSRATPKELLGMKGMKEAKVSSLVAALELGKRLAVEEIDHLDDWAFRVQAKAIALQLEEREFIVALFLDARDRVLSEESISYGGLSGAYMDLPFLFRRAVRVDADSLIIMHNHPDGSLLASEDDRRLTTHLKRCTELLDLRMKGHYILAGGKFRLIEGSLTSPQRPSL